MRPTSYSSNCLCSTRCSMGGLYFLGYTQWQVIHFWVSYTAIIGGFDTMIVLLVFTILKMLKLLKCEHPIIFILKCRYKLLTLREQHRTSTNGLQLVHVILVPSMHRILLKYLPQSNLNLRKQSRQSKSRGASVPGLWVYPPPTKVFKQDGRNILVLLVGTTF